MARRQVAIAKRTKIPAERGNRSLVPLGPMIQLHSTDDPVPESESTIDDLESRIDGDVRQPRAILEERQLLVDDRLGIELAGRVHTSDLRRK